MSAEEFELALSYGEPPTARAIVHLLRADESLRMREDARAARPIRRQVWRCLRMCCESLIAGLDRIEKTDGAE